MNVSSSVRLKKSKQSQIENPAAPSERTVNATATTNSRVRHRSISRAAAGPLVLNFEVGFAGNLEIGDP